MYLQMQHWSARDSLHNGSSEFKMQIQIICICDVSPHVSLTSVSPHVSVTSVRVCPSGSSISFLECLYSVNYLQRTAECLVIP